MLDLGEDALRLLAVLGLLGVETGIPQGKMMFSCVSKLVGSTGAEETNSA
jgi:hypothetical protein